MPDGERVRTDFGPGGDFRDEGVALDLGGACTVEAFLRSREGAVLDHEQCRVIVEEAIRLLEGLYVHLPLKRARYAVDPVRRLRLLELRLQRPRGSDRPGGDPGSDGRAAPGDDLWFHREMLDAFTSVRDLHTAYILPRPFNGAIAFLPFQVEDYFEGDGRGFDGRKFMVSNVIEGLDWFSPRASFVPGVEVTHWNGVPIRRAVEVAGERNAGGNPDARLARGLARLTVRPLAKSLPPDEEWVTVHYKPEGGGEAKSVTAPWRVVRLPEGRDSPADGSALRFATGEGLDEDMDQIRRVRGSTYAPKRRGATSGVRLRRRGGAETPAESKVEVRSTLDGLPSFLEAKIFAFEGREYGHVRIRSFKVEPGPFLAEFVKAVERLPRAGLVIDVRDNPGGYIATGERLLQLLTPGPIQPEQLQFINSDFSRKLCDALWEFRPWAESVGRALETGAVFSSGVPLSRVKDCNDTGQRYYGPVVLVTNALCYSTTDVFAAGFQDHGIGPVLGTDGRTGAGGANVVTRSRLLERFDLAKRATLSWMEPPVWPLGEGKLPGDADIRVAIRRTLRVGEQAGTELEDLGVVPTKTYRMSKRDVLQGNLDLIAEAAGLLRDKPAYYLRERTVRLDTSGGAVSAEVETQGIEWLDVSLDGWEAGSQQVWDNRPNPIEARRPTGAPARLLELRGYRVVNDVRTLVAGRKIKLDPTSPG